MAEERIIFVDTEVNPDTGKVLDYGAVSEDGAACHSTSAAVFGSFLKGADILCGHNILDHDWQYIRKIAGESCPEVRVMDTLYLSPLLFPRKPYHHLLKDDKLQSEELNNPLNDARKCMDLFNDEKAAFLALPETLQQIYGTLLRSHDAFSAFFHLMMVPVLFDPVEEIRSFFLGRICEHADLNQIIQKTPVELAYTLALLDSDDRGSVTPPWVMCRFPQMDNVIKLLRGTPCHSGCSYCNRKLDVRRGLKRIFGFDSFRSYEGVPLQERAAAAAVAGRSLLAVFPTGGGKSVTFQLPAIMAGETSRGLTVVISPLQSLMKDQVDHLEEKGITDAAMINGLLNPIERKQAVDRVADGAASILYISPESLRSRTVETLLLSRNVVRFVIDEAHCFSAWGQDFRVDYLYIGDFIRKLRELKHLNHPIPVSCFTATAKQKVISDIQAYFRDKLGLELQLYTTDAARKNLRYSVLYKENDEAKYLEIRNLIQARNCPTIVYASRVKRTLEIAGRLRDDGLAAEPYNGRMDTGEKIRIQNAFLEGKIQIIAATSAFGMGVDKKDVGLVIHHDISDSLENYVQEAGRAGRDETLNAECYVLFNESDLDKHFILLNQTKLSLNEINQVWKAVKTLTVHRPNASCSALEIARQAGWDEASPQMETRVTSALAALEDAGYLERGRNVPHIYASSILVPDMKTAAEHLEASRRMTQEQKETAKRVISYLISRRSTFRTLADEAESRVDYLADRLGISRREVVDSILLMREEGLLADHMDLSARLRRSDSQNRSAQILKQYIRLEEYLIAHLPDSDRINYKALNDQAVQDKISGASVRRIKTIVLFWMLRGEYAKQFNPDDERVYLERVIGQDLQALRFHRRAELAQFIVEYLFGKTQDLRPEREEVQVTFSVREIQTKFSEEKNRLTRLFDPTTEEIQAALLYLSKIQALSLDGGFLVSYNAMQIHRKEMNNRVQYKAEDYRLLNEFYRQRIQQIHIVGEYAHLMVRDYQEALNFVSDYFRMDYRGFLAKYFKGNRLEQINRNITPERYERLFGELSPTQRGIVDDENSMHIVVAAGPGSGKTKLLVHKLAALLTLEDIKHDQLLMLTFSRASATEFKRRLLDLIGNAAHFVQIRTFHSYCFDLLGRYGNLQDAANVIPAATQMIESGEVEPGQITKAVLVIDEAQDMDQEDYRLVLALMRANENMKVIAVGDDDQNIFAFRHSDSGYMLSLITGKNAKMYEMTENFRSDRAIVALANAFAAGIRGRIKKQPIHSMKEETGCVTVFRYRSGGLTVPLADRLLQEPAEGNRCVLTRTNEEAACITGILHRKGVPVRLIQSNDGFPLTQLAELRFFVRQLENDPEQRIYSDEDWQQARRELRNTYVSSKCLPFCDRLLDAFESVNRYKYRSDFQEFLLESRMEDYSGKADGQIVVSTIHKAKGMEFDHVTLLLDQTGKPDDDEMRAIYVGITRAKHFLTIHTTSSLFDGIDTPGLKYQTDEGVYGEAEEILVPLTHRDVVLSFYHGKKERILRLRSGEPLQVRGMELQKWHSGRNETVVRFSASCRERITALASRGYRLEKAAIRFIVYWQGQEDPEETAIVLPDLYFRRDALLSSSAGQE